MGEVAELLERPMPQSIEIEKAVLGAILAGHQQRSELLDVVHPEDFFNTFNRTVFVTIAALHGEGVQPDAVSVYDALTRNGRMETAGVIGYLSSIGDGVPRVGDMMHSARRLRQMRTCREAIHIAESIKGLAFEQSGSPSIFLDAAIEQLSTLARDTASAQDEGSTHFEAATQALLELDKNSGPKICTDVDQLDRLIGGFRQGELVIITAETGSGKTLLAQQTRARACRDGFHSLFCSGEMLAPHLKRRELAAVAGVEPIKMRREDLLTPDDRHVLIKAATGPHCNVYMAQARKRSTQAL